MSIEEVTDVVDKNKVAAAAVAEETPQPAPQVPTKGLTFSVNVPVDTSNSPLVGNFGGVDFTVNEIANAFHSFVQVMVNLGLVPTVEKVPLQPFAMGNYSISSDVRPHKSFVPFEHKPQEEQTVEPEEIPTEQ